MIFVPTRIDDDRPGPRRRPGSGLATRSAGAASESSRRPGRSPASRRDTETEGRVFLGRRLREAFLRVSTSGRKCGRAVRDSDGLGGRTAGRNRREPSGFPRPVGGPAPAPAGCVERAAPRRGKSSFLGHHVCQQVHARPTPLRRVQSEGYCGPGTRDCAHPSLRDAGSLPCSPGEAPHPSQARTRTHKRVELSVSVLVSVSLSLSLLSDGSL